ncbi:unnamed protein product [Rhizophagus irregularis]|nr:unnamed protein product [Rhizophagus irregularis]CAB5372944.1 unnamed protein product [Rhizophagus irregularis]
MLENLENLVNQEDQEDQEIKYTPRESKYCSECNGPTTSFGWCVTCETNFMKGRFPYWSSGNKDIDELIRHTQLNSSQTCDYLEWIPFEAFEMVKYIGSGGSSSVYSALWMEGPRLVWDEGLQEWTRTGPIKVALKRLDNSINITSSYVDQIKANHKCIQSASLAETFGITRDPTSNYMIVMKYYENGNLYQYLDRSNGILSWKDIIDILWGIAEARDICNGERLEIPEDTPSFYAELMQRCWDNDPAKRPNASYLNEKMGEWITLICDNPNPSEIFDEYNISEDKRWKIISHLPKNYVHPEIHPEAFYVSRPLRFLNYIT